VELPLKMGSTSSKKQQTRGEKFMEAKIAKITTGETSELEADKFAIRDLGAQVLADYLRKDDCKVKKVYLRSNKVSATGMSELGKSLYYNKSLEDMTVIDNKMGDQLPTAGNNVLESGMATAANMVYGADASYHLSTSLKENQTLTSLTLEENNLGNEGAEGIAVCLEPIRGRMATLTRLALRKNEIGDKGSLRLAEALRSNSTLVMLDIQENDIGNEGGAAIAAMLGSNTTLTEVNLRANDLTAGVCAQFAGVLESNKHLLELNLRRNSLKDEGCATLAKALERNSTLKRLHLSSNLIGNEGCSSLADSLKLNSGLEDIYLEINNIEDAGCVSFAEALEANSTLQKVDLRMNSFRRAGYQRLATAVEKCEQLVTLDLSDSLMESKPLVLQIKAILKKRDPNAEPDEATAAEVAPANAGRSPTSPAREETVAAPAIAEAATDEAATGGAAAEPASDGEDPFLPK